MKKIIKLIKSVPRFTRSLWEITPSPIRALLTNKWIIAALSLSIGGIVGNRSDEMFVEKLIPWFSIKNEVSNLFFVSITILFIISIWLLICIVRFHDDRNKFKEKVTEKQKEIELLKVELKVIDDTLKKQSKEMKRIIRNNADEFYPVLTKMVVNPKYKSDLLISIGEGESLQDWLLRIFEEARAERNAIPQINRIVIKKLSDEMCDKLMAMKMINKDFKKNLYKNICEILHDDNLKYYNVTVQVKEWDVLPVFHGFVYDRTFLINKWTVNEQGHLHVRTSLYEYTAIDNADYYDKIMKYFYEEEQTWS